MKFFKHMKDGGPESTVHGYWLCEIKSLFSIGILVFEDGSRENYHNHAFSAVSWILKGKLLEKHLEWGNNWLVPSWKPVVTPKNCFHKVTSYDKSYAITFRGPWSKRWKEYSPISDEYIDLEQGRIEINRYYKENM